MGRNRATSASADNEYAGRAKGGRHEGDDGQREARREATTTRKRKDDQQWTSSTGSARKRKQEGEEEEEKARKQVTPRARTHPFLDIPIYGDPFMMEI